MARRVITLVTPTQAKKGTVFSVRILPKCKKCKLYNICVGKLREGVRYQVVEVRKAKHMCPILNDFMYVAIVKEKPITVAIERRKAISGISLCYNSIVCEETSCPYYKYCVNTPIKNGEKIVIKNVLKPIPCSRGFRLVLVEAEILP